MKDFEPMIRGVLVVILLAFAFSVVAGLRWCAYSGISEAAGHYPDVMEFVGLQMLLGR